MSEFIERSKNANMTSAVEDHFGFGPSAKGFNSSVPLPAKGKVPPFGHPNTGVNYRPAEWAGTTPEMVKPYGI